MTKTKHLPDIMNNIFSSYLDLKMSLQELDCPNNVLAPKRPTKAMMQRGEDVINQFKNETAPPKILAKEIYIHMISGFADDAIFEEKEDE